MCVWGESVWGGEGRGEGECVRVCMGLWGGGSEYVRKSVCVRWCVCEGKVCVRECARGRE